MVIHSVVYVWENFQIFSMRFTVCFALKVVWTIFKNDFLGRTGPSPPLKINLQGQAWASTAPRNWFVGAGNAPVRS